MWLHSEYTKFTNKSFVNFVRKAEFTTFTPPYCGVKCEPPIDYIFWSQSPKATTPSRARDAHLLCDSQVQNNSSGLPKGLLQRVLNIWVAAAVAVGTTSRRQHLKTFCFSNGKQNPQNKPIRTQDPDKKGRLKMFLQTPEEILSKLEKLEERLRDAKEAHRLAKRQLGEELSGPDGPNSPKLKSFRAAERAAEAAVFETDLAIDTLRLRHKVAIHAALAKARSDKWSKLEQLLKRRMELAIQLEDRIADATHLFGEILKVGDQIRDINPTKNGLAPLSSSSVETDFRLHLVKVGHSWAFKWPWGPQKIMSFKGKILEANQWVFSLKNLPNPEEATAPLSSKDPGTPGGTP